MELSQIIKGCINKDAKAQKEFVLLFSPTLMPLCRRYSANNSLANDFLQESLIQILYNIDKYKEEGKFEAWIKQVTVRKCIELLRKNKKYSFDELKEFQDSVEEVANHNLELEEVKRFLNTLPDHYRLTLNMFLVEGYSHKEIAQILNIKESNSRTLVTRGRAMIKKAFTTGNMHVSYLKKKEIKKVS